MTWSTATLSLTLTVNVLETEVVELFNATLELFGENEEIEGTCVSLLLTVRVSDALWEFPAASLNETVLLTLVDPKP